MKYPILGALVSVARRASGFDQAEVARQLDVGQQAVSGWERGLSRPRQSHLPALCKLLDLDLEVVTEAAGYAEDSVRATQSLAPTLPFENLSAEGFEAFVSDLMRRLYPGRTATRNGSSGYAQFGVDVFVEGGGERIGVQCKRHETFGPERVDKAIAEVTPRAGISSGVIALSRTHATPAAKEAVRAHEGWTLYDGEDLSGLVRTLPLSDAVWLVDTYFRGMREPFLGVREPSPWLTPEEFDATLDRRLGIEQDFSLAGRVAELQALAGLTADMSPQVILVGRGGTGKTRLLREFARAEHGRAVVFAGRGAIAPQSYETLPDGAPVVIVDDATVADFDVRALEQSIRRVRPEATLILSTRPTTLDTLLDKLELPSAVANPVTVTIGDLTMDAAETLAREALDDFASDSRVSALAHAGYDCPFVIVFGAHLLRGGSLTEADLAKGDALQQLVLERFKDVVVRGSNAGPRMAVLEAVAAVQPARLDETEFIDALVGVSGQPESMVLDLLDELEGLGLILRRGSSVRVVPDLLGDAILQGALISKSGVDKGFAPALADRARGAALSHALRNVSVIDWYLRTTGASDLADVLWTALTDHALTLPNSGRKALAKRIAPVAAIYAERALDLVDQLLESPADDEEDPLSGIWGEPRSITSSDVALDLAPLIANAANDPRQTARAMRLLTRIGRTDLRKENPTPSHALRLLRELGEYAPRRSVGFARGYLEALESLINDPEFEGVRSVLVSMIKGALAHEVRWTESNGWSITMSHRPIDFDKVAEVRAEAIEIARRALGADDAAAYAAVEVLREGLHSAEPGDPVTEEFAGILGTLRDVLANPDRPAGIRLAAFRALGWHATYGTGERRSLAREARRDLCVDDDLLVLRIVRAGLHDDDDDAEGDDDAASEAVARYHRSMARLEDSIDQLVARWTAALSPIEILERLHDLMNGETARGERVAPPNGLLHKLFAADPHIAQAALTPRSGTSTLDERFAEIALASLLASESPGAEAIALDLISRDADGALLVAWAITGVRAPLAESRERIFSALIATGHPRVLSTLLMAARTLEAGAESLILAMLAAAPIESDADVADAAIGLLATSEIVPWASLSPEVRAHFLERLLETPQLGEYHLGELMQRQIALDAGDALTFLQRRAEAEGRRDDEYTSLPFLDTLPLDFRSSPDLPDLIDRHIEWMLRDTTWSRHHDGMQLLEKLFGGYGPDALAVILELIRSQDEARIGLARDILNNAPRDLVVREPAFVADALEISSGLPANLRRDVVSGLHGSATYGSRTRSVGVDDPEEIELRDRATEFARRQPEGSGLRAFYEEVARRAAARIASEREDDATLREPRQW